MSRKDMEREIGRNTTLTSRLQYVKDIPTPEDVQVFTPSGEENFDSITLEANIDSLPDFQALPDLIMTISAQVPQSNLLVDYLQYARFAPESGR